MGSRGHLRGGGTPWPRTFTRPVTHGRWHDRGHNGGRTLHQPLRPLRRTVARHFFTHAHNFGVSGGTFQSIKNMHIHHAPPAEPPDFPTIPMGYLNLLRELRLNADTGVVDHHQSPVRRAHSARIHGSESTMTVAIYQGHKAEENWREAISKHSNLRHPNIIQLFGTARTSKIHAAIFHDELIPARQMAEKYDITPIGTVYLRYFLGSRSSVARNYVESVSGDYPVKQLSWCFLSILFFLSYFSFRGRENAHCGYASQRGLSS
ncbi:hypothetical protein B0H17DRAFT_357202 [Mycena rosella]|uniref:Protein kinase domain-containing protein n=1 Tax=Mycena rosella TaxID=1033263 RepID=A0AAD7CPW1_MYCRO|nr:hypothetical protein B0H17DRAFT_357202 [Mycena rosella]